LCREKGGTSTKKRGGLELGLRVSSVWFKVAKKVLKRKDLEKKFSAEGDESAGQKNLGWIGS